MKYTEYLGIAIPEETDIPDAEVFSTAIDALDKEAKTRKDDTYNIAQVKVDKKSPMEFDLPMTSGFVKRGNFQNNYSKDQTGKVKIHLSLQSKDGTDSVSQGTVAAILPVGYRPKESIISGGFAHSASTPTYAYPLAIRISTDGSIYLDFHLVNKVGAFFGEASFYTND